MYNHAPKNYGCPFCAITANDNNPYIFYRDKDITAFISSNEWPPNSGIVLIIPNKHYENLYDIDEKLLAQVQIFGKKVALAMKKAYNCEGVSTRQHNEPEGYQSVWHYHLQVIPRYKDDHLYRQYIDNRHEIAAKDRLRYAKLLKKYFHGK
jgi:histidine triad (HIT) family protein